MYQATSLEWDQDAIGWTETEALSNLRHAISIKLLGREQHSLPEPVQVIRVGRIKVNAIQPLSE
ncbi:MAG: hypothetical protein O3A46_04470 [Candidatus Poribacteria bacterium]|nr:hypothetical protein [Candidatus Poribacteria bacterium]